MFYGVIVYMYYLDNRRHHAPHIHAEYQGAEVVIDITSGEVLEGDLPATKLKLVAAWVEIHRDELLADWSLAIRGEAIFRIEPLR
jgi:hypothetical protein